MKKLLKKISGIILATVFMLQIIPTAMAATEPYLYNVTDVAITNLMGTPIIYTGGSCTIQATIQKNWQSDTNGIVVVMGYSANNTLLSLDFMYNKTYIYNYYYENMLTRTEKTTYGTTISLKEGETLALVKVAVWEDLESMKPLSEVGVYTPNEEFVAPPASVPSTEIDGTLISGVYSDGYSTSIEVFNSATSSSTKRYELTDSAELYVNGFQYCDVYGNEEIVQSLLQASTGTTELFLDEDRIGTQYGIISTNVYATAVVGRVEITDDYTTIVLNNLRIPPYVAVLPGAIRIHPDDIADGIKTVKVTKNGEPADISALKKDDVIAVKYDISSNFNDCYIIDITATDKTVTGQYRGYDEDTGNYLIGDAEYKSQTNLMISLGTTYTYKLDPFGRLFSACEAAASPSYAIVGQYVNVKDAGSPNYEASSSTQNYIDVVTFDGITKRLYIRDYYADEAEKLLNSTDGTAALISSSEAVTAKNVPIEERIFEYRLNSSGQIARLSQADVYSISGEKYNSATGILGAPISKTSLVLDATEYDVNSPNSADYKASSLSALEDGRKYDVLLCNSNDENMQYGNIVIVSVGDVEPDTAPSDTTYNCETDFAVATANASITSAFIVNDKIVYRLKILENGANETSYLYITSDAVIMVDGQAYQYSDYCATYLKKGAAFFYTTNADGFADRIDVILNGGYSFEDHFTDGKLSISLPDNSDGKTVLPEEWTVGIDADSKIQLFAAPVVLATDNYVLFGEAVSNEYTYVDTNKFYPFALTADTKIYSYDLSDNAETNHLAFSDGNFTGFNLAYVSDEGYAYTSILGNYDYSEYDFNGAIQTAFVMAVDGVVTNAIVFNN